jgi:hypothetical protein
MWKYQAGDSAQRLTSDATTAAKGTVMTDSQPVFRTQTMLTAPSDASAHGSSVAGDFEIYIPACFQAAL